jgi:two-component system, OmpR family, phosphate regulon sensor histidine kinase PhoR
MPEPLPTLWRSRRRRMAAVVMLFIAAALAMVLALDPVQAWADRTPALILATLLLTMVFGGVSAVVWQGEREAARVRRALAAGISHDMRTPLAQIRMFTEMLLIGHERSEEERVRWLESIERESHRLGDVMENLLLFIHGDEPDPYPARQPVDLGALIEDVAVVFASRAAVRRMTVIADPPAGVMALVDPQAVRQVIGNLLDNALRYGPSGQTVTVSLDRSAAGEAVITVQDRGPGVPAADRSRVWQPFVRLDGSEGAEGSSGLGLAVVRQVVEAHGGWVSIGEANCGGARVCVSFPTAAAATATTSSALAASA